MGEEAVARMDYLVNVERMAPREAAAAWMLQHADPVERWFAQR